jgi:hypothetical protein
MRTWSGEWFQPFPGFLARPLVRNVVTLYIPRNDITEMTHGGSNRR